LSSQITVSWRFERLLIFAFYLVCCLQEYGGLVKFGVDLDQFDVQPVPDTEKSSVYQTIFNGEKAILKV
jgi:hypothetical protein